MAFVKPNPEDLRAEFHRLCDVRDSILAKAGPAREAYEAKRAELEAMEAEQLKPLSDAVKVAEDGLYDINNQIGEMSRWLNGKTGARPSDDTAAA